MFTKLGLNPWRKMWVQPRKTISAIVDYNPGYLFPVLSAIYGLPMLFSFAQNLSLAENFSLPGIIIGCVILSFFLGMLGISIVSMLIYWTGKWIGGTGSYKNVRAAVAWSNVPITINILMWFVLIAAFKSEVFLMSFPAMSFVGKDLGIVSMVYIVQSIMSIWSFIVLLQALGQVQGFSAWRALLNVIIPFVMVMVAIWILVVIYMQIMGPSQMGSPQ